MEQSGQLQQLEEAALRGRISEASYLKDKNVYLFDWHFVRHLEFLLSMEHQNLTLDFIVGRQCTQTILSFDFETFLASLASLQ